MPFELRDWMVWLGADVSDHRLEGILDSDSDETFLDTKIAEHLGLQDRTGEIHNNLDAAIESKAGVSFDLGPSTLLASSVKIIPIGKQFPGMDFIIGFDALRKTIFTLDYSKSLIQLGSLPRGLKVPFTVEAAVPTVKVAISNIAIRAVVDTGAPAELDLPFGWVQANLPSVQLGPAVGRRDLGPRYESLPFVIEQIQIDGLKIANVQAEAIRRKDGAQDNQPDDLATIGNRLLSRFAQVGIDGPGRNCVFSN